MTTTTTLVPPAPLSPPRTRAQARRSYDVADFPVLTGREEEWRFTPLKRLRGLATANGSGASGDESAEAALTYEFGPLPDGLTITTVPRAEADFGRVLVPFDRISALAFGRAQHVLHIEVAKGSQLAEAATVRLVGTSAQTTVYGHTLIDVGQLAEATLVLEHTGSLTLADNVEVVVADGARLTLITIADWAADAVQAQHIRFQLGRDARLTHVQVTLGADVLRQYTSVEYVERGGDAELYGLFFAGAKQHLEHRLLVDHAVPDCRSYVAYRGALQGVDAHTVWVGDVLIRAEATGTDTYEVNRNLVLSDGARADSVPNLEIETGEVIGAGHASATGRFDDEQLFYLMSRGIPQDQARRLVVRGFFAELLAKVPLEDLRHRLGATIEERLVAAGA